ncbi:hypothetical protein [Nostoc sp. LEGE 12450]|uniref:hypothetical protein n=1 Tax=Nostoc sp. LEGE 12450 TaxID=1828643 RepID=UPI001880F6C6|nr:hypothetical protein [Nostoc sp. LEGE 12450]MBE8986021.1 hypothetical protein [Nostoc sp. LEGE 12450]
MKKYNQRTSIKQVGIVGDRHYHTFEVSNSTIMGKATWESESSDWLAIIRKY